METVDIHNALFTANATQEHQYMLQLAREEYILLEAFWSSCSNA